MHDGIFDWEQFLNSYVYYDRENHMVNEYREISVFLMKLHKGN